VKTGADLVLPNPTQYFVYNVLFRDVLHPIGLFMAIGGFNQRQREELPPQIFLTLKFVVCVALKIIEIVAT